MEYSCSNQGHDDMELPQMQLFVQSKVELENVEELSRVLHLAVTLFFLLSSFTLTLYIFSTHHFPHNLGHQFTFLGFKHSLSTLNQHHFEHSHLMLKGLNLCLQCLVPLFFLCFSTSLSLSLKWSTMDDHLLEVLQYFQMAKWQYEIFNLSRPSPMPSLPHMLEIAGAYPLISTQLCWEHPTIWNTLQQRSIWYHITDVANGEYYASTSTEYWVAVLMSTCVIGIGDPILSLCWLLSIT